MDKEFYDDGQGLLWWPVIHVFESIVLGWKQDQ